MSQADKNAPVHGVPVTAHPAHTPITEEQFNKKGFWAMVVTQFQGAFNDNLFQFVMIPFLVIFYATNLSGGEAATVSVLGFEINLSRNVENIASFFFSLPFILFPAFFGALADRFSKQRVALFTKFMEIGIMTLAGFAFYMGSPMFLWIVLFFMATQSAMFGPAKYGIMPEIMPESRLSWGNGIVQMTTIAAIIMGVALAGPLYSYVNANFDGNIHYASIVMVGLSVLGMLAATRITRPPAANPNVRVRFNPILIWSGMGPHFKVIWGDKVLLSVVFGYLYFWFAGVLIRNNVLSFAMRSLNVGEDKATFFVAALTIGIGIGALIAGFLSRKKIELGLVPIGALGIAFFSALLAVPVSTYLGIFGMTYEAGTAVPGAYFAFVLFAAMCLGISSGIFDVPLAASIQQRAPARMKGGVIAAVNMMSFVGMASASLLLIVLNEMGFSENGIFAICSLLTIMVGLMITLRLPHLIVRSFLWILANTFYRVKTLGRDCVPEQGGALLVSNHLSMVDCLALIASTDRQIRFIVGKEALNTPWMARLIKISRSIVYDPDDAGSVQAAIDTARAGIAEGSVVCLSTENALDSEGNRVEALEDLQAMLDGTNAPVVPVHLDRMWGRLYTFENGKLKLKRPPRCPYPIQANYGETMAADTPFWQVRQAIERLGVSAYMERPLSFSLVHHGFIRSARKNKKKRAIVDLVSGELTYFKTLIGSIIFARKLGKLLDKQPMTGVLLPPSVGGVLTNVALQMMGRVPVNLNYTASPEVLDSCARQCEITQVLTSRKFLSRLPNAHVPGEAVYVDDIKETVKGSDRIIGLLLALLAPIKVLERIVGSPGGRNSEDLATIVFSSGSEGEPKGVMLSHRNLIANIEQSLETFPHHKETSLVGYLPFFHSFGFMATLWMPITSGLHALYHPNPLEPKVIGELIEKHRGSIMIGTSTFLQHFIRRCTPEQLSCLEFVVTGAEKLAPRVRTAFKEKFGVEPLEGYGTTECAPAVSVNIPDLVSPGFHHIGTRHGTIGRCMPGQSVRVEDPDTGKVLGPDTSGLLWVKGPNIMQGYLHMEAKTAEVLVDGWYATGDIAAVSEDGFITITDRLARFSKIGGEMVPHTKVEETLHTVLGLTEQSMAVASVPDAQKGERLLVLHTLSEDQLQELKGKLDGCGLPNLWIPRSGNFYRVDEIPVLATGKMDIKSLKQIAQSHDAGDK